jgi:alpha-tubulin suppressor-like RCC1 family protein
MIELSAAGATIEMANSEMELELIPQSRGKTRGGHTRAVIKDGSAHCWGDNSKGQLGIGSVSDDMLTPTKVVGLDSVTSIATGLVHTCAVL